MSQVLEVADLERYTSFKRLALEIWPMGAPEGLGVLMTPMKIGYFALQGRPDMAREGENTPPESVLMVTDFSLAPFITTMADRDQIEAVLLPWSYQNEHLAKGGFEGANTPAAHVRKEFDRDYAAIRKVPISPERGWSDIYVGRGNDSLPSHVARYLQHGFGFAGALARDYLYQHSADPDDRKLPGTDRAIWNKAGKYGGATCALLPISPIFRYHQRQFQIDHRGVVPGHVVVNMKSGANPISLERVATCRMPTGNRRRVDK